jgi:beta-xylosidase
MKINFTQMKKSFIFSLCCMAVLSCATEDKQDIVRPTNGISKVWNPDIGDGTYKNPVIFADYSDPDVVRVGDDYYMTSSSFNCSPALPILHSYDLVNWQIVNYVFTDQKPLDIFNMPQHGNGVWAPSIRYHNGEYFIFYGDPDFGIYMAKTTDPKGHWTKPYLVKPGKGWIDPCPLWDDDGKAYLVHAWAGSRAGIKSILTVHEMSPDGTELLDNGVVVFDGHQKDPTVEGPKFYKKDGFYYILAPAGGVSTGWQLALRSKNARGPYERKIVLHQGNTKINGPHQGGWVETQTGESWFIHFQDKGAYGRIVYLQPVTWKEGWPEVGIDGNNDGIGEPVMTYRKPNVGKNYPVCTPQASDEFSEPVLGLQWQWHANADARYGAPSGRLGFLRLNALPLPDNYTNFWQVSNLLLQKFTAEEFTATAKASFFPSLIGDRTGLIIMGEDYSSLQLEKTGSGLKVKQVVCKNSSKCNEEKTVFESPVTDSTIYFRVKVSKNAVCSFSYSTDSVSYTMTGEAFTAVPGRWIGAKVGLFCVSDKATNNSGYVNYDWFRVEK